MKSDCDRGLAAALSMILCALTALGSYPLAAQAQDTPPAELKAPAKPAKPDDKPSPPPEAQPDILLVMPNSESDEDDVSKALQEAHGTVIRTVGEGAMKMLVIQTEKGKLDETEKKLGKDKNFSSIQRNYVLEAHQLPNDPLFPQEWHLAALNVPRAWQASTGSRVIIGVADSGSQYSNPDLYGKIFQGRDFVKSGYGWFDYQVNGSHGTAVATTAAAITNNRTLHASPAYGSYVFPLRIGYPGGDRFTTDAEKICAAIYFCGKNNIKILNVSYGGKNSQSSLANRNTYPMIHNYLRWYHDVAGGIAVFSAGNSAHYDTNPRQPYLVWVSALSPSYSLAGFSSFGIPTWFVAPGEGIACSDRYGRALTINGTSFSAPLIAAVIAMVWGRNPSWSNRQVEQAMINSCINIRKGQWNPYFGWGMPDAAAAIRGTSSRDLDDESLAKNEEKTPSFPDDPEWKLQSADGVKSAEDFLKTTSTDAAGQTGNSNDTKKEDTSSSAGKKEDASASDTKKEDVSSPSSNPGK